MMDTQRRILVIGPAWVGDLVMAQSLFRVLKEYSPNAVIDAVAPPWTAPLLTRMPEIRNTWVLPIGHGSLGFSTRWHLGQQLRAHRYQQAIVLPRSFKAALVPFFARAAQRTGYRGELRWGLLNDIRPLSAKRTVDRFVALGVKPGQPLPTDLPLPSLTVDSDNLSAVLAKLGVPPPTGPVLALCPGAEYGPAKRWPATHFAQVARKAIAAHWRVWLFGSARDATVTAEIQQILGGAAVDFAGRTSLPDAVDLLSRATTVVTNDSGLMHIAAAVGRPVIALFGSSDPQQTPPLTPRATVLRLDLPCSPCLQRTCPQNHLECLQALSPAQVLAALPLGTPP